MTKNWSALVPYILYQAYSWAHRIMWLWVGVSRFAQNVGRSLCYRRRETMRADMNGFDFKWRAHPLIFDTNMQRPHFKISQLVDRLCMWVCFPFILFYLILPLPVFRSWTQIVPQTQLMQPNKFCFFDAANFPSLPFFFFFKKNLSKLSLFLLLIIIFPASELFLMSLLHKNNQKRFWAFWFQSQGEGHHISLKSRGKALLAATNSPFRWSNWPMKWMEPAGGGLRAAKYLQAVRKLHQEKHLHCSVYSCPIWDSGNIFFI